MALASLIINIGSAELYRPGLLRLDCWGLGILLGGLRVRLLPWCLANFLLDFEKGNFGNCSVLSWQGRRPFLSHEAREEVGIQSSLTRST